MLGLYEAQLNAGGIADAAATDDPRMAHFGNAAEEYSAARSGAVIFDLSDRTEVVFTGNDRHKYLHNFCTNEINKLAPGGCCEAFLTNVKARVLGHGFVLATESQLIFHTVSGQSEALLPHLDRYLITEDVDLTDATPDFARLYVTGPEAEERLQAAGLIASPLTPLECTTDARVARLDWFTVPGYLIRVPISSAATNWEEATAAGIAPAGRATFEALRIESGFPAYGRDITEDHLAPEVGRNEQAINYNKGCYLGQEPIARLDAMGHVNKTLCRLVVDSAEEGLAGRELQAEGAAVGAITSAAAVPGQERTVALGYIRTAHAKSGQALAADGIADDITVW